MVAAKYLEDTSVLKPRKVRHSVESICRSFLVTMSVFDSC